MVRVTKSLALFSFLLSASAHPGVDVHDEVARRSEYLATLENTSLAKCAGSLAAKGQLQKIIERRQRNLRHLRIKRGLDTTEQLQVRDLGIRQTGPLSKTHKSTQNFGTYPFQADWSLLGQNRSVVLAPEVTEGPFYVEGEYIRRDIRDGQKGVPLHLDIQVIDIKTCQPVPGLAVDLWSANATGVYSGVISGMNGNIDDKTNLNNRAIRGIQIADKDGAVQFDSLIPAFYEGRATHIHVMTHVNPEILPNKTIKGGKVSHVGQFFFDDDLVDKVASLPPYNTTKTIKTTNKCDFIMQEESSNGNDPIVEYVLIGKTVEEGIFGWINFGIDTAAARRHSAATICYESGCVSTGKGMGPPGFGPGGKGPKFGKGPKGGKGMGKGPPPPNRRCLA